MVAVHGQEAGKMAKNGISRREFLCRTGLVTAAASGAAWLNSKPVRAAAKRIGPNDRIALGFIGVGAMGRWHFDRLAQHPEALPLAVADPDGSRRDAVWQFAARRGSTVAAYADYREMLDRHPGMDAVFIATPDHWHAIAAMDAMRAGMDVYCEGPLALTIGEGRDMVTTARQFDRVVQVGTQQRSEPWHFRHACEMVRTGRIGEVRRVVCFFGPTPCAAPMADEIPPADLDWDLYVGPAPARPFNRLIHPYNFRYIRDFSGGLIADWGVHLFDIAQWGLNKDHTSPRRIEAQCEWASGNFFEFPRRAEVQYDYGDAVVEWRQGCAEDLEPGQTYGTKFYGSEGEICVNRGGYRARRHDGKPLDETLDDTPGRGGPASHHQDFFECLRTRRRPVCDVETGHRATVLAHLGNIAMELGRPLDYDPAAECFPGDGAANAKLRRPMRAFRRV
jgi:predicted dehydrogenase